jgi:DNA/RNA endonuclease G (NUC1)
LKNKNIWIELEQQCFSLAIEKGNLESEDHVIMPKHDLRP